MFRFNSAPRVSYNESKMGVLGSGLYAGDFAMDLRSAAGAVLRLPFDGDRIVAILRETELGAADDPNDPDHTVFWLVVADQLARRGVASERARDTALRIIESGADLAMHTRLRMDQAGLRRRKKVLDEIRERILAPAVTRAPRKVLKKPQAWLFEIGDVIAYPTFHGHCINPHFSSKADITHWIEDGFARWEANGWAAMVLIDRGRAFDFLSWYRVLTVTEAAKERASIQELRGEILWKLSRPGTLSALHTKRMEFEKIGALPIDESKVRLAFPAMVAGRSYAVGGISLANTMNVGPAVPPELMPRPGTIPSVRKGRPFATILGIDQICAY